MDVAWKRAFDSGQHVGPRLFASGYFLTTTGGHFLTSGPGGNLTGVSFLDVELMPKRLDLLSELVPQAGVIALLVNPTNPNAERVMRDVQEAARTKGVQLPIQKAGAEDEFETAFASLVQSHAGALLVGNATDRASPPPAACSAFMSERFSRAPSPPTCQRHA
jgi:hypothetical protein